MRSVVPLRVVDGATRDVSLALPDQDVSLLSILRPLGIDPVGVTGILLDGRPVDALSSVAELRLVAGSVVAIGRGNAAAENAGRASAARRRPIGPFLRRVRLETLSDPPTVVVPSLPKAPPDPPSFPWLMALAPIPVAGVLAMLLGPRMAVFAALGPLMVLARYAEGRRVARRDRRRHAEESAAAAAALVASLAASASVAAEGLRLRHPAPETLLGSVATGDRLWSHRSGDESFLAVGLGTGRVAWDPPLGDTIRDPDLATVVDERRFLDEVPLVVDLLEGSLGIVGRRTRVEDVLRAIVADLVVHTGPADLEIALGGEVDVELWDSLKWLPHAVHAEGPDTDGTVSLPGLPTGRHRVLLIDGPPAAPRGGRGVADSGAERTATIVFAEHVGELPAECGAVLRLEPDRATLRSRSGATAIQPSGLDATSFDSIARSLAAAEDPEVAIAGGVLPTQVTMGDLHGRCGSHDLQRSWARAAPDRLRATVGIGPGGPARIDLVADGPHALAAGTTGAGKSEFLRTLVLSLACGQSPQDCTFVLVDYKGGGAFDACAELPHTAAVVTDLDEHLARRSVRGLRAELRRREELLRAAGESDLIAYRSAGHRLARLVIVVDEFATLAAELPSFLDSLVDVAQRGRSLGLHLVLATQRPAGVLDGKIRANTNLRICLRVQDVNDSIDVLGSDDASRIDRSQRGRGFLRFGDGDVVPFQSGYSGTPVVFDEPEVGVEPFTLATSTTPEASPWAASGSTELERLVARISDAATGIGSAPVRPPWLPPIPSTLTLDGLVRSLGGDWVGTGTVGVLDDPDQQRRRALAHDPASGNLLVVGADAATTTSTVLGVGRAAAAARPSVEVHLHRIAVGGSRLGWFEALPHHGTTVDADDLAAVERLVDLLEREVIERRGDRAASRPALVVLADGLGALFETLSDTGERELVGRLNALLRDGPALGLTWVAAARSLRSLPGLARNALSKVWIHRLADASDYGAFGLRVREVPAMEANAVIDPSTGLDGVVAALTPLRLLAAGTETTAGPRPARLRRIDAVDRVEVDLGPRRSGSRLLLPIGLGLDRAEPVAMTLEDGAPALIVGRSGSGRTTLLERLGIETVALGGIEVVRPRGGELVDLLLASGSSAPKLVLIDDIDRWSDDDLGWIGTTRTGDEAPVWIVVAAQPSAFRRGLTPLRALRGMNHGFVLGLEDPPLDLFSCTFPKRRSEAASVGRGWTVSAGTATPTQVVTPS